MSRSPRRLSALRRFLIRWHPLSLLGAVGAAALSIGGMSPAWRASLAAAASRLRPAVFAGDTVVVFGPKQYNGSSGQGQTYVDRFTTTVTAGRLYSIRLINGAPDGTRRASKVIVKLNGFEIVAQNEVTQAVAELSRPVAVTDVDTLRVTVAGSSSPYVTISILSTPDNSFNVHGPTQYAVSSGSSTTHSGSITLPATAAAPYRVYVVNGASDGTQRVTSGSVTLNGTQIVTTSELTTAVGSLTKVVTLNPSNTLGVTVNGSVGRYVTVRFTATDTTKPGLTITAPAPNALTNQTSLAVSGTISDQTATAVTVNGVAATVTANTSYTATVPLTAEGNNLLTVTATDAGGRSVDSTRTVRRDTQAPSLSLSAPADGAITKNATIAVTGTASDANGVTVNTNGTSFTVAGDGSFSGSVALSAGPNVLTTTATDGAGNATSVIRTLTQDEVAPVLTVSQPADGSTTTAETVAVSGTVSDATAVAVTVNGVGTPVTGGGFSRTVALAEGANPIIVGATDAATNQTTVTRTVTRQVPIPPDPSTLATPIDPTVATSLAQATAFLYTGPNAIQTGVASGAIVAERAAVLRGKVIARDGSPLSGVRVSVLARPELGQTISRADGMYDLAVNGGGALVLQYTKGGYIDVQRDVRASWQAFATVDSVAMTPRDTAVTTVGFVEPIEVARGTPMTDASGTRRVTLMFEGGTLDSLVLPDGSTVAAGTLHVRATEFTVGSLGPAAMPGTLPSSSAYTYAMELSADEATSAGATGVRFSKPVAFYVENFLSIPVGRRVPVGVYDRKAGKWTPEPDGRVIKILGITSGRVDLDLSGSGQAAGQVSLDSLGITDPEREKLAALYPVGQTLWRTEHSSFSARDLNYGQRLVAEAAAALADIVVGNDGLRGECRRPGSTIRCESQGLGEEASLTGTPFTLHYASDRVPGRQWDRTIRIARQVRVDTALITSTRPVRRNEFTSHVQKASYSLQVAGRSIRVEPALGPSVPATTLAWDGKDAYGRTVRGRQHAKVSICFTYPATYGTISLDDIGLGPSSFGAPGSVSIEGVQARQEFNLCQNWEGELGAWDARGQGLGGWTLNAHHVYDPTAKNLYRGDGVRVTAKVLGNTITRFAGTGTAGYNGEGLDRTVTHVNSARRVAVGPDGSVYYGDQGNLRVRRVAPNGIVTTIAGNGTSGSGGDGGPATSAQFVNPRAVAVGPDGSVYVADANANRVRRIVPGGTISTVAGTGVAGYSGDGGPGTAAKLNFPVDVAVAPDGVLYIAEDANHTIRRVDLDGRITTYAGIGTAGYSGDNGPARQAHLHRPTGIAVGPDGTLYISDQTTVAFGRSA